MAFSETANAQDLDKGVAAYHAGDYESALSEFSLLANQGNAIAAYNLSVMYSRGEGVPRDNALALGWIRFSANKGYTKAQVALGRMHLPGGGLAVDNAESLKWYLLAAEQGHVEAQIQVGIAYTYGLGVTLDYGEALKWFRLAADKGNVVSQKNIGRMYAIGAGVQQDYAEALKWYRLAADQGNADAQSRVEEINFYLDNVSPVQEDVFTVEKTVVGETVLLTIVSRADSLGIGGIIVNRGKCSVLYDQDFILPIFLEFADKKLLYLDCDPIEVIVKSTMGEKVFTW